MIIITILKDVETADYGVFRNLLRVTDIERVDLKWKFRSDSLLTPSFGRMHNLNVNAIYIGEQSVDMQFQLPITICKGGNQLKQGSAAVRLKYASLAILSQLSSQSHLPLSLS